MDRYGRFDLQDGIQIYGALRGFQQDQRQDEAYQRKLSEEQQYKQNLGNLQKNPDYKPDMNAPGYDPDAWNKAALQQASATLATDEATEKRAKMAQQRIELQRNNIARGASDALAVYQTDPQAGTIAMLKTYDQLHDGIEIVKDDNGNPLIDEKGQITLKGLNGSTTTAPIPPMGDMIKMAQMYTDPKNLQKVDAMSSDAYRAANASAIAKAKHYQNDQGQVVAVVDQLYDPIDRSKVQTVVLDLKTGQPIDPAEFAQGGFREISRESTDKFGQQVALKGLEASNDRNKLTYEYQLKGDLERTKAGAQNKGGVGSAEAKNQLELVLMPFAEGKQPLFTMDGDMTAEGQTALQKAQTTLGKYQTTAPKTLTEKREAEQAKRALQVYSNMHDEVMRKWGPGGKPQASALSGGGQGQAPVDVPNQAANDLVRLKESGLSDEEAGIVLMKRYPTLKVQDDTARPQQPIQQPIQQPQGQSAAPQQQGGGISPQQAKAEFQGLARQYGKDKAKQMMIQKYPGLF